MTTLSRLLAIMIALAATGAITLTAPAAIASSPAGAATRTGCGRPAPGRVATLVTADNGRTICAHRGQRITVALRVDPTEGTVPEQWWQAVTLTGTGLAALPETAMPVRGTTLAHYQVTGRGTATLSSTRRPCAPPANGGVTCQLMQAWSVRVTVR